MIKNTFMNMLLSGYFNILLPYINNSDIYTSKFYLFIKLILLCENDKNISLFNIAIRNRSCTDSPIIIDLQCTFTHNWPER